MALAVTVGEPMTVSPYQKVVLEDPAGMVTEMTVAPPDVVAKVAPDEVEPSVTFVLVAAVVG